MKRLSILFLILCMINPVLKAQKPESQVPERLQRLFERFVNSYVDSDRIRINDSIEVIIDSFAHSDSAFNYRFPGLKHLGQITSSDSLIKIITWNIILGDGSGKYFCYLLRSRNNGKGNELYTLIAPYSPLPISADTTYNSDSWYGALYYNIKPVVSDGHTYYMLLGLNYGNPEVTRKMIDVLDFKSDTTLTFGKKWFDSGKGLKYRVVLEYSATAMVSLRYGSGNSIVFDHLVPFSASGGENRKYYGPEYTYDAYIFDGSTWKFKHNVDARNKE